MKRQEKIELLIALFGRFQTHEKVFDEIQDLILGSGQEIQFFKLFQKAAEELALLGIQALALPNFEALKEYPGLYSMHLQNKSLNIRILYSYNHKGEILLHCFYEREDSEVYGYRKHAPIALARKKEMEGKE